MAPRVFVSYSHDSTTHADRVLGLAHHLRSRGVDVRIDRFEASPPMGWPRWMHQQIEQANKVLMVCTPTYQARFEGRAKPGSGHGATWEGFLIYQMLYNNRTIDTRCVPLLLDGQPPSVVPLIV